MVWPTSDTVANWCGSPGAFLSHFALEYLGYGAYFGVLSLFILAWRLNRDAPLTEPTVRSVGWLMALVGLTTVAALAGPWLVATGEYGPGGFLGASFRALMSSHLTKPGAVILAMSLLLGGLLLCTDYVLLTLTVWVLGKPSRHVLHGAATLAKGMGSLSPGRFVAGQPATATQTASKESLGKPTVHAEDDFEQDEDEYEENEDAGWVSESEEDELPLAEPEAPIRTSTSKAPVTRTTSAASPAPANRPGSGGLLSRAAQVGGAALAAAKRAASSIALPQAPAVPAPPVPSAHAPGTPTRAAASESEEEIRIRNLHGNLAGGEIDEQECYAGEGDYQLPPIELLLRGECKHNAEHEKQVRHNARLLEKTFLSFGFKVKVVEIETGPVISQYEVELEAGLRLSKITSLSDDLAIALRVPSVRIVAPIPGKNTVGIEVPNKVRQLVRIREVIEESTQKTQSMRLPLFLGKDVSGNPLLVDMTSLPHLLIAGRTGTGKSVCLNSLIVSMLMTRRPDEVRMLMIDPKMVELSPYKTLPHLMHPVVTDMKKAEAILGWAVEKMEERYALLARAGVRHMSVYNQLGEEELRDRLQPETDEEWESIPKHLPYIVIIADEMADLMMTAPKEVETHIIRLAQKSRAVGIHLVLATQKPTVDVITGLIKSNLPARIAFQVASRTDSRVVLDEMGADKLLGNGDMLFLYPGTSTMMRGQGTYVSDEEINAIVDCIGTDSPQFVHELVELKVEQPEGESTGGLPNRDELYASAVDVVVREGRGSVSLLQRALGIGYGRAARLVDYMAEDGIVGAYNGSQAREVTLTPEQWAAMQRGEAPAPNAKAPSKPVAEKANPPRVIGPANSPVKASRDADPPALAHSSMLTNAGAGKISLRSAALPGAAKTIDDSFDYSETEDEEVTSVAAEEDREEGDVESLLDEGADEEEVGGEWEEGDSEESSYEEELGDEGDEEWDESDSEEYYDDEEEE